MNIEAGLTNLFRKKDKKRITGSRASVINGLYDFTEYGREILKKPEALTACLKIFGEREADILTRIILAECQYQKNDCYKALVQVSGAMALLGEEKHAELWFVTRYIQMCVMIVTGQVETLNPIVNSMKNRVYLSKNRLLIDNYEALAVWCALYDDEWKIVDKWMNDNAPNEFGKITLDDCFRLFIKARVYLAQNKYLALIAMLEIMRPILEADDRIMQLCELYMLYALALYGDSKMEEAFEYLEKALIVAHQRQFDRLLADEGRRMYDLLTDYLTSHISEEKADLIKYAKHIQELSRVMLGLYPQYLNQEKKNALGLTNKETEILSLMVERYTNGEIAEKLDVSINTVKYHSKNIYKKLEAKNRVDAVKKAMKELYIKF
ncbi:MAG: LuxR C-terminal-related transcriptional regulator [Lachnospiraceae bacterium]|nr:LuxR C-terminal-related transcriptional regulator [Lachnospiraceae bacterium]